MTPPCAADGRLLEDNGVSPDVEIHDGDRALEQAVADLERALPAP